MALSCHLLTSPSGQGQRWWWLLSAVTLVGSHCACVRIAQEVCGPFFPGRLGLGGLSSPPQQCGDPSAISMSASFCQVDTS